MRDTLITLATRLLGAAFPSYKQPLTRAYEKILIIKPCCLGDVVLATPVVTALRRAYPAAQIDFAVGSWSRAVIEHNPHIKQIIDSGAVGQGRYGWGDVWRLAGRVRAGGYDLCVTLDRSPRVGVAAWLAGVPVRAGLDNGGRGFAHNVRVPVPEVRYEPELYLDVPRALGTQPQRGRSEVEPTLFVPTADEIAFTGALLGTATAPIVAIHPGGGNNPGTVLTSKRWPAERFAQIADRLIETYGATVVLIGAAGDATLTQAVRAAMRHTPLDTTGKMNIGQLGALYQRCVLMIGNDTGTMHLANAVGTPVVALYGPSDPRIYGPYNQKSIAIWHDAGCNPCFRNGRARPDCCPNRAIETISVDEVWQAAQIVLRRQGVNA
ncbi:MAG: lipopolysaccharide heptosyltransferase II [Chloroflexi bacterium]|nr:lipopolysaccharide heptosyltransferase II [Chloroflexota bacterium]